MKTRIVTYFIGITVLLTIISCKKYLEVKSDNAQSTITTIDNAQKLLDDIQSVNLNASPYFGELSSDNYYYSQATFDAIGGTDQQKGNLYIWGRYPFINILPSITVWSRVYAGIMIANSALDGIKDITINSSTSQSYNNVKGSALAYRGYYFWKLVTTFAKAYNNQTASIDLGIPLRLNINFNEKSIRGNVQQTYDQIIKDLNASLPLLPVRATYINRPSKICTYAMLAELYLSMRNYDKAYIYADSSLSLKHDLINYNNLDASSSAPIPVLKDNVEILCAFATGINLRSNLVDTNLYTAYKDNDLRKRFFFRTNPDNTHYFSGTYYQGTQQFIGPTTAEMYLIRAECLARRGKTAEAMGDLNTLMKNRINTSTSPYLDYSASSSTEALQIILQERRKELVFRDLRWMDIKRLNLEGANITLTRKLGEKIYTLPPNDNRFAIQIPPEVVQISGAEQNPY